MEVGSKRPSLLWLWGPNSRVVVYMDPLGINQHIPMLDLVKATVEAPLWEPLYGKSLYHKGTGKDE